MSWGSYIGPDARAVLFRYARLLARYDRANVIGTQNLDEIMRHHVLDSLSCLLFEPLKSAKRVADIGSGGGLPGIPLAVALPETRVTLFESTQKKVSFLQYAQEALDLSNVQIVNGRVEEAGRQNVHRGVYDVCAVRAVARISVLAEYCLPLLRVGGHIVAMKGREDQEEWAEGRRAAKKLRGFLEEDLQVRLLPEMEQKNRRLVLIRKLEETPSAYPRRTGVSARNPLGRK